MIRVLLVDDQTLVRQGITSLLALSDQVHVAGEAADGDELAAAVADCHPHVILLDIRMPRQSGIEALRALRASGCHLPVIILTTFDDHQLVLDALAAGAQGYLLKDVSLETLVEAIATVNRGDTLIQPAVTERIMSGLRGVTPTFEAPAEPEPLSPREQAVLRLMAGGYSNREIALALHKSEGTIKNQVSTLLAKLGVRDRTRAVLLAIERDLL
ncbi:response regulator [Parahaliea aestuarii]|uniref:Response regulator transcription factor n=1 Tax=Parahaliea aestuarii TaxID=1852021 RepID=A0A5C9A1R7_9GAMM|nr:response regulator transcription factor [Parahaliea aestuarii]TXS94813.1 response regulator transcription factor [Parahaliea aestuarii]